MGDLLFWIVMAVVVLAFLGVFAFRYGAQKNGGNDDVWQPGKTDNDPNSDRNLAGQ